MRQTNFLPTRIEGPEGVTDIIRQQNGNFAQPTSTTINGVQANMTYDGMLRLTGVVGPAGETASFGWDAEDRPTSRRLPDGSTAEIRYSYSPALTTEIVRKNRWTRQHLDGLGRVIKEERGYGGPVGPNGTTLIPEVIESIVETEYVPCACGPFGKVKRVSRPRNQAAHPKVWTEYVYDWAGRTVQVKHAPVSGNGAAGSQGVTGYEYSVDGTRSAVKVTDPAGRWKRSYTDGFGDLVEVREPRPGGGEEYSTTYVYNALGKLSTVTMPRDGVTQTRSFEYLATGQLWKTTFPENGTTEYTYDNGRVSSIKDALGRERKWIYENGRLKRLERWYAGVQRTAEKTEWTYDVYGRLSEVSYSNGRPSGGLGVMKEKYGWTPAGQLHWKEIGSPAIAPLRATWTYDAEGRVDTLTYPSGQILKVKRNAAERETELYRDMPGSDPDELQASATYDWRGLMTNLTSSVTGGKTQDWSYNEGGQMTWHHLHWSTYISYDYGATPVAGKLHAATQISNRVEYGYDELGRLTSATSPAWSQGYVYDGFGNLKQKTGTKAASWTVNSARNTTGTVDAVGNTAGFTWDADNRMVVNGINEYTYDAGNQRVVEYQHEATATDNPRFTVTFRAGGAMLGRYRYRYSQHTLMSMDEYKYLGGKRIDAGSDRLGSDLTGGRVILPYGEELSVTPDGGTKFATYWRDEGGLDYADQRYYSPGTGKFLSSDPYMASGGTADPGSWNRYAYVEGDPINNFDPSGLITCPAEYGFATCVANGYLGQPGIGTDPVDWCFDIANRFGNDAFGLLQTSSCGMWMTPGSPFMMAALMNPPQSKQKQDAFHDCVRRKENEAEAGLKQHQGEANERIKQAAVRGAAVELGQAIKRPPWNPWIIVGRTVIGAVVASGIQKAREVVEEERYRSDVYYPGIRNAPKDCDKEVYGRSD